MPHIKWVGIINSEIADYQKGTMDCSAKKMALPATVQEMMIKALPFTVLPFTVIFLSIFLKTFFAGEMTISPIFFVIGFIVGFIGLIAHEWLHAIVYPANATVYIGFHLKSFAAGLALLLGSLGMVFGLAFQ